ncbi:hypothetical protein HUK65_08370 [Rhodobacteraceae bacterium 2376]|uniref:Uncharacterized protein n=1 Tax=Rhabdonatronobacter sediminivivens TaxID=2743469 RepID=A0A7Z0HZS0_9RHOB|nr:hypothetical protein [Rhabdonatronobacter sediminivivens]NYS25007.1 hypothetical protein [Rhabdonatronobacter sediminivivens]
MEQIKDHYMREKGGDREFVDLLLLALEHGIDVVEMACDLAVEQRTLRLPAIINLVSLENVNLGRADVRVSSRNRRFWLWASLHSGFRGWGECPGRC